MKNWLWITFVAVAITTTACTSATVVSAEGRAVKIQYDDGDTTVMCGEGAGLLRKGERVQVAHFVVNCGEAIMGSNISSCGCK